MPTEYLSRSRHHHILMSSRFKRNILHRTVPLDFNILERKKLFLTGESRLYNLIKL